MTIKCLLWTDEKGWREGDYLVLNVFHEYCFLPELIATCSGPAIPAAAAWGNFRSLQPSRQVPASPIPTCWLPVSACSSAHLPFPSIRLNVCPESNNPDSVSSAGLASSAKDLLPASCWLSPWKLKPVAEHPALQCRESVLHLLQLPCSEFNGWDLYKCSNFLNICSS